MIEYLIVRAVVEAAIFAPQLVISPIEMVAEATSKKVSEIKTDIQNSVNQKIIEVKTNIKTSIVQTFDSALDRIANKLKS